MRWTRASRRRNWFCGPRRRRPSIIMKTPNSRPDEHDGALSGRAHNFRRRGADARGRPLNSAFFLTTDGHLAGRYDKRFLVPFGEFVPPLFEWVNKVSQEAGDFVPGTRVVTFIAGGTRSGHSSVMKPPSRTWCARWPARALKSS